MSNKRFMKLKELLDTAPRHPNSDGVACLNPQLQARVVTDFAVIEQERNTAVANADNYRQRVLDLCDSMISQENLTIEVERQAGLKPEYREQYIRAVESIKKTLENYNHLKEAELEGSFVQIKMELEK